MRASATTVAIELRDRGPGVPAAHRRRIFAAFDRGSVPTASNDQPGVGLGLALSRGLARDIGGELGFVETEARTWATLSCKMRVLEGGDGGAFVFLNTSRYGQRGPAPYVANWTEPNLAQTFAVGIDVHNPKNEEPFSRWGNYQGLPEREVSLHWDGREIVKRVAETEFRGDFADVEIRLQQVIGGAEASVRIGASQVYDRYFIAELEPYESRLAIGAGTRAVSRSSK